MSDWEIIDKSSRNEQNASPNSSDWEVVTPPKPVSTNLVDNESPVSLSDRTKLSAIDNNKSALKYLKGKFEDARETNGELEVKDSKGWHPVNPKGLDIGDITEAVVGTGADIATGIAGASVGSIGGPVGSIAGAGVASGALRAGRNELARQMGVEETPEDQIKAVGWDMLGSMAGQSIGLGVGKALNSELLAKAATKLKSTMSQGARESAEFAIGKTTGAGTLAVSQLFETPSEVQKLVKPIIQESGSRVAAQARINDNTLNSVKQLSKEIPVAFSRLYNSSVDSLVKEAPKNFSVSLREVVSEAEEGLVKEGVLQKGEILNTLLNKNTLQKIFPGNSEVSKISSLLSKGAAKGETGVRALSELSSGLNELTKTHGLTHGLSESSKNFISQANDAIQTSIANRMGKVGLQNWVTHYNKLESLKEIVELSKGVTGSEQAAQLLTKLVDNTPRSGVTQGIAKQASSLVPKSFENVIKNYSASQLVSAMPNWGSPGKVAGALGSTALGLKATGGMAAAAAPLASPAAVRQMSQALPFVKQTSNWFSSLGEPARQQLMSHPTALGAVFKEVIDNYTQQDNETQKIVGHGLEEASKTGVENGQP